MPSGVFSFYELWIGGSAVGMAVVVGMAAADKGD
jgi:hypothetical protein